MFDVDLLPKANLVQHLKGDRYLGTELGKSLDLFSDGSQHKIRELYRLLQFYLKLSKRCIQEDETRDALVEIRNEQWRDTIQDFVAALNQECDEQTDPGLRKVCHDLRGGALTGLMMQLDLAYMLNTEIERTDILNIFNLVRDHLKIMRNCLHDLDPEKRKMDLMVNEHSTRLFEEKWENYKFENKTIKYVSEDDWKIASCCLEFSTVDRVVYNLANNALKYSNSDTVELHVHPLEKDTPRNLRILTFNQITKEQEQTLRKHFGDNPSKLFYGGYVGSSGKGLGMNICLECVSNAYGINSQTKSIEHGYAGVKILQGGIAIWIHWPLVGIN